MTPDVQVPPAWEDTQFNALFYLPPPYLPVPALPPVVPPVYEENADAAPPASNSRPPVGPALSELPPRAVPTAIPYLVWIEFPPVNWQVLQVLYMQLVQAYVRTGDGWSSAAAAPAAVGYATNMAEWYFAAALIMGGDFLANVVTDGVNAWGRLPVQVIVTYSPNI